MRTFLLALECIGKPLSGYRAQVPEVFVLVAGLASEKMDNWLHQLSGVRAGVSGREAMVTVFHSGKSDERLAPDSCDSSIMKFLDRNHTYRKLPVMVITTAMVVDLAQARHRTEAGSRPHQERVRLRYGASTS